MSLPTEIMRQDYDTDGMQTSFPITFPFSKESVIHVFIRNKTTGVEDELDNPADFTISGTNVITTVTWPSGYTLVIKRILPLKQDTEYIPNDPLNSKTLEYTFDDAVKMIQQLQDKVSRALLLPETSTYKNLMHPEPEENY